MQAIANPPETYYNLPMSKENRFDTPFTAALALREKHILQNYHPNIAVHKWFARRPGMSFHGIIISEPSEKTASRGLPFLQQPERGNNFRPLPGKRNAAHRDEPGRMRYKP